MNKILRILKMIKIKLDIYVKQNLIIIIAFTFISCQISLDDKIDLKNYESDLKSLVNESEQKNIIENFNGKKYITQNEYQEMTDYLKIKDSLEIVKSFVYRDILYRIKYHEKIKKEIKEKIKKENEERKKKKELERVALHCRPENIYFRDTEKEVLRKIKANIEGEFSMFFIWENDYDYRIHMGNSITHFSYKKGYGDEEERLDYFTITLDIHTASSYNDYYVGETKYAYDRIIKHFETYYGKIKHYYPRLSDFGAGYGDRFDVAQWNIGETWITIRIYETEERRDRYGRDSYKTKYIVKAVVSNYDLNLKGNNNE